jgi:hypothetical protein
LDRIGAKFPSLAPGDCGLDTASAAARATAALVLAGLEDPIDITSDNAEIAAAAEQDGCEAANGTWDGSVCTPAAAPDRDCFRGGACGVVGHNYGDYEGVTLSSSGCSDTTAGTTAYTLGQTCFNGSFPFPVSCPSYICLTNCDPFGTCGPFTGSTTVGRFGVDG